MSDATAFLFGSDLSLEAVYPVIPVPVTEGTARLLVASSRFPPSLSVQVPGYGITAVRFLEDSMDVKMRPSVRVSGRLLDEKGQPLAGIRFGVGSYCDPILYEKSSGLVGPLQLPPEVLAKFVGVTDADGTYRIDGLPPGAHVYLETEDKRLIVDPLYEQKLPDSNEARMSDLHVRMGATYSGRVRDGSGYARKANVVMIGSQGEQYGDDTNDEGSFSVVRLPPGNYDVMVLAAGEKPDVKGIRQTRIRLGAGESRRGVSLYLPQGKR